MSWIEEELRRREAQATRTNGPKITQAVDTDGQAKGSGILALWDRLEATNAALPEKLQLRRDARKPPVVVPGAPGFLVWLVAPNGAALGLTGDGIRYVWPEENRQRSYNFWIHCSPRKGYRLVRRVGPALGAPSTAERRFDERKVDAILRGLVTNTRIDYKAVTRSWWRSLLS